MVVGEEDVDGDAAVSAQEEATFLEDMGVLCDGRVIIFDVSLDGGLEKEQQQSEWCNNRTEHGRFDTCRTESSVKVEFKTGMIKIRMLSDGELERDWNTRI